MCSDAARCCGGHGLWTLFVLCYITWHLQLNSVKALYFAKVSEEISLPHTFPIGQAFFEAYVLRSASEGQESSITFHFKNSTFSPSPVELKSVASNEQVFQLILTRPLPLNKTKKKVTICAKNEANSTHQASCLSVRIKVLFDQHVKCNLSELCFGQESHLKYKITENSEPQALARLAQSAYQSACKLEDITYSVTAIPDDDMLYVNDGILEFSKVLNREKLQSIQFQMTCNVTVADTVSKLEMNGTVNVTEENEHGPVILNERDPIIITVEEVDNNLLSRRRIGVEDVDAESSLYSVELINDPAHFFNVTSEIHPYSGHDVPGFLVMAHLHPVRRLVRFVGTEYVFGVRFEDLTLHVPGVNRVAVVTIKLTQEESQQPSVLSILEPMAGKEMNATIFNSAAQHSRVMQPIPIQLAEPSHAEFILEALSDQIMFPLPFDVTRKHGIVYVNDSESLQRLNLTDQQVELQFKLRWKAIWPMGNITDAGYENSTLINIIIVNDEVQGVRPFDQQCGQSATCSHYGNKDACSQNCGQGAISGHCQWHDRIVTKLSSYATCSPELDTCPDGECDALESRFPHICPQDCVETSVRGTHFVSHRNDKRGIQYGEGICTCSVDEVSSSCMCGKYHIDIVDDDRTTTSSHETTEEHQNTEVFGEPSPGQRSNAEENTCGLECIAGISGVLAIILMVVSLCCVYCKKDPHRLCSKRHKYPGSLASLPAVPSDYVDERSSSIVSQNAINNELLISISNKFVPIDSKWEFSRNRLIIEQTLGEGEFGRVMKARALDISVAAPGYSTVAVKMLKCNGSSNEQDLLSEFNLLKEVSHPNVIKLLGACSAKDGPLLIIVEYAEFGSLRSYLRKTRRLECKSCTSDDSGVDSMASGSQADHPLSDYQVNPRDLLSFGWQIAKGMAYLSDMKLVHRDLAARNILVASGKVVKISDFGLTRDVYEGDAYFKKSMGRVPVKWMAIESLLDHIYTTKSDVWSFGIVLWEIVTLGAAPYPGVVAERLFHLLKTGYRMEKPENCSDELYNIMRRCWQEHPHERPPFSELTKVFDNMLQANVEYLDLGLNMVHNMTYFDDTPALTDTIGEDADEGEESERGYGSLNVLPTDDSEYLQSNPRSVEDDEEDAFLLTKSSYEIARSELAFKEDEHAV